VRHSVALAVALSSVVLAWCICAFALDPSLDISQYAHTAWKVRDGFAKGAILPIAQTPDGYLWLGTEFGLLRFDGVRAVPWQPPDGQQFPGNYIQTLLAARDGTLWIGTDKGLASWKDGKLKQYREVSGLYVASLLEDRDQTVWFGVYERSKGRLCTIRAGKIECRGEGILGDWVFALYQDHSGNLWAATQTGLWRWSSGSPERYAYPRGITEANALIEDDAGVLLLATNDGLKRLVAGRIENYRLPGRSGHFRPLKFLRSSDGSLWIGTQQGLLRLHRGKVDGFRAADGLSGDFTQRIFEDHEGNIWVATIDGLDRFREFTMPTISRSQGLSNSTAWSVQATPDGTVWIGTPDGINRWADGQMTVYRGRSALSENRPRDERDLNISGAPAQIANSGLAGTPGSLGLDDAGRLWTSTNEGVFYFDRSRFVRVPGIPGGNIYSIAGDGHGNVWILHGTAGILRWSPKAVIQQFPLSQFPQKTAVTILPDKEPGGLWLGFAQGSVVYLKDGKTVRSYGSSDGLGHGVVSQLRFGSRDGVWAATEGGLSRIQGGHIETLSSKNGLPCDQVHWSMEDDYHAVWVYMPCGLARVEASEWHSWVDDPRHVIKATTFDISDGVRTVGRYGGYAPHVTKSSDGRIWFLPFDGVSVIDPRHLPFNQLPPPVQIEKITADGKDFGLSQGLRLPSHVRDLEIDYTALSFVDPSKVHFRYKLEGFNRNWHDVDRRQVYYANLPPGNYQFQVVACNNSGVWNQAGASLGFSVLPAFYQTSWFRALCATGFLALLWGLYQLRVKQLHRQFNIATDARVNERTRIARELHDTLLQNFHGLMFQFQAARNLMARRPDEAIRSLDNAINETKKAIAESRDAIQGLRSEPIAKGNLAELLMTTSRELTASAENGKPPVFDLVEEGERQTLSSTVSNEVCRIALELMRNAYQHAHANRIETEIRYGDQMLRLRVRDDGRGIDPKVLKEGGKLGHWGLRGVRERAERIGARLDVWSEPGSGTEAQLTIPASIAYENFRDGYRAKLVRKMKHRA
jgi:signal transduction histidine kinase/ligand-binding sensor domain-containing protein